MDNDESLRPSALRLPLPARSRSRKSSSQSQCSIFANFPLEIRRLIWIECLGGLELPLSFSHQYRWDILRTHCDPAGSDWDLAGSNPLCYSMSDRSVRTKMKLGLLPILQTCQRVYSEAVIILYSCNKFRLVDICCLLFLPKLLIPPHLNAIRFLDFTMKLEESCTVLLLEDLPKDHRDEHKSLWTSQWKHIASMERLRELHIQMTVPLDWRRDWIREQISLLNPLKLIMKPKVFVLTLPFRDPAENESALQELPCEIQRALETIDG